MSKKSDAAHEDSPSVAPDTPAVKPGEDRVMLVLVLSSPEALDEVITALVDIGVRATIIESRGMMSLLREEVPIFGGLASMLPDRTGSRVVLSLTSKKMAEDVFRFLVDETPERDRPVAFTVPVSSVVGGTS
jgi:hypothetical protein